jgi:hypothetical protein
MKVGKATRASLVLGAIGVVFGGPNVHFSPVFYAAIFCAFKHAPNNFCTFNNNFSTTDVNCGAPKDKQE